MVVTVRGERARFLLAAPAGRGAIVAYGASELLKTLVTEERPCRAGNDQHRPRLPGSRRLVPAEQPRHRRGSTGDRLRVVMPRLWPLVVPVAAAIALPEFWAACTTRTTCSWARHSAWQ